VSGYVLPRHSGVYRDVSGYVLLRHSGVYRDVSGYVLLRHSGVGVEVGVFGYVYGSSYTTTHTNLSTL
jgi:hypothetical protein